MGIQLCNCENTLLSEIADKIFKRKDVAMTYRLAIDSSEGVNWEKVNRAIMNRWSVSGLVYIKTLAWRS